jgi:hypothetical protein
LVNVDGVLLNYLVPSTSNCFSWWLQPVGANVRRIDLGGATLLVALYALTVLAFGAVLSAVHCSKIGESMSP